MNYNNNTNSPSWFDCFNCAKISSIACERTYAEFYWQTAVDAGFVPADLMYMKDTIIKEVLPSIWPNGPYELFTTWTTTFNPIAPLFNRYSGGFSIQEPQVDELRYMVNMIYQWFAARQVEAPGNLGAVGGACESGSCSYPFNRYGGDANANMSPIPSSIGKPPVRVYCPQGYVYDPNTNMCVPKQQVGLSGCGCGCNSNGNVGAPLRMIPNKSAMVKAQVTQPSVAIQTSASKMPSYSSPMFNSWEYRPKGYTIPVIYFTTNGEWNVAVENLYGNQTLIDIWSKAANNNGNYIGKYPENMKAKILSSWKTPFDAIKYYFSKIGYNLPDFDAMLTVNKDSTINNYALQLTYQTRFIKWLLDYTKNLVLY